MHNFSQGKVNGVIFTVGDGAWGGVPGSEISAGGGDFPSKKLSPVNSLHSRFLFHPTKC